MSDTLTISPSSGSEGSKLTKRTSAKSKSGEGVSGTVRLRSLSEPCGHPGTGLSVPSRGEIFEADAERGLSLVACGLAELAAEAALKGE